MEEEYTWWQVIGALLFLLAFPVGAAGVLGILGGGVILLGLAPGPWGLPGQIWSMSGSAVFMLGVVIAHVGLMLRFPAKAL